MGDKAFEVAQQLDKQILIWAVILLFSSGLIMVKVISNQLSAILKRLDISVEKLTLGFERHNVILEHHARDLEDLKGRRPKRNGGQ